MNRTPKLLPWFARKAGVSEERAATLWRKAIRQATADTGWVGNTEYWGEAMSNFLTLLEKERCTLCSPQVTPLIRTHHRFWALPLVTLEMLCGVSARWHHHALTQYSSGRRAA